MPVPATFAEFLPAFFDLFTRATFDGRDYLGYLAHVRNHTGDEAKIVDRAVVAPLLELLGFAPAEQVYNAQKQGERPDYVPSDAVLGPCFIVEDKATALDLNFDLSDPTSHLSQLRNYVQHNGLQYGWLTNGKRWTVWRFLGTTAPQRMMDFDIPAAIHAWTAGTPATLPTAMEHDLQQVFDLFRRTAFTDSQRLKQEISLDPAAWQAQALPLTPGSPHETLLVEAVQLLIAELQRQALRDLEDHLRRYAAFVQASSLLDDNDPIPAREQFQLLRDTIQNDLAVNAVAMGLSPTDQTDIVALLYRLEVEPRAFTNGAAVEAAILGIINAALIRKYPPPAKASQPWTTLRSLPNTAPALGKYTTQVFAWHTRRALLRHDTRTAIGVQEDFTSWASVVQETMLGDMDDAQQRAEFALQTTYVVFIRLLLVRVCEDKGVFPQRMVSDGGLVEWHKNIQRYLAFANGNPYSPLLDMAYTNAQNIYAHFFSGRELFNWYRPDEAHVLLLLHQLNRFDFAAIASDVVGTIYGTYISRAEKRNKGQYYTPPAIVTYILNTVGYGGAAAVGPNKRLIDPACGSGSFLVAAAKRLVAAYETSAQDDPAAVLNTVKETLYGFDLNPFACYLAEVNLLIQVLDLIKLAHQQGQRPKIDRFHVYNVDALTRSTGTQNFARFNTLLAAESDTVEQIKAHTLGTPYAAGFAFVVANPPYGATLSEDYKAMLRRDWPDVFQGQPDTYVFFLKLGLELLASGGQLGYITPNTYLMGTHSNKLRAALLAAGAVREIVDLPQGIWKDANVDCVLLFLQQQSDEAKREAQQVQINALAVRDSLDKLENRTWAETLTQPQAGWLADPQHEMNIRHDPLLQGIEDACRVPVGSNGATRVLRLGDVTDSSQGIIPYYTRAEGSANPYIRSKSRVPRGEPEWKPLLDASGFIGRYELRWGAEQPYLKYGTWLYTSNQSKYYESPKLLVQDMRNRALKRRLVATYDDQKFYNRHNFSNIIAKDANYSLKYILALFNSSLLNYWFAQQYSNLHINPSYFRQLPIYPADDAVQAAIVALVDQLLARQADLNRWRVQGYTIRRKRDGSLDIVVPYDGLLAALQAADSSVAPYTLFEALAAGLFTIPPECDRAAPISSNVFISARHPDSVTLRHNKLWFEVPDPLTRRYLLGYLRRPRWHHQTWDQIKNRALLPVGRDLTAFVAAEAARILQIENLLQAVADLDAEIDRRVFALYGISDPTQQARIQRIAPPSEEEEDAVADATPSDLRP